MARAIVVIGVPQGLEDRTFKKRDGSDGSSLAFRLHHTLTALSGSLDCEASDPETIEQIRTASINSMSVVAVAHVNCVRYEKDGDIRDFAKLRVRAVMPSLATNEDPRIPSETR